MQLGMVGLGRMGGNMTKRLERARPRREDLRPAGRVDGDDARGARDQLDAPRAFWMMVPAGEDHRGDVPDSCSARSSRATRSSTAATRTSATRSAATREAKEKGITFVDAGVSGGIWGLEVGYCLMVGGDDDAGRAGRAGLPRARARGRLRARRRVRRGPLHEDGPQRDRVRAHAGVRRGLRGDEGVRVRPRPARDRRHLAVRLGRPLVAARAAARGVREGGRRPRDIRGYVEDSGEGRWTIAEAIAEDVPVPVITAALFARFASRQEESFAAKVNAALRNQFGGHAVQAVETAKAQTQDPRASGRSRTEPAARGAAAPATPGPVHPRHLRRVRRPDREEADAGAVRARVRRLLPEQFGIVGAARTEETDDEFRERMKQAVQGARARRVPRRRLGAARRRHALRRRSTSPTSRARTSCATS